MIPLITRRSSTRGTPCDNGKCGSIRRICASDNQNRSLMATPPDAAIESDHPAQQNPLIDPEPKPPPTSATRACVHADPANAFVYYKTSSSLQPTRHP